MTVQHGYPETDIEISGNGAQNKVGLDLLTLLFLKNLYEFTWVSGGI